MRSKRYSWGPQEVDRRTDWDKLAEDPIEEMVRFSFHAFLGNTVTHMSCRYTNFKDHITLADYEIHDGMSLEMY